MNGEPYNPDDPLFLLHRSMEGDLSDEEQALLERLLAESPELRAEAERLRALNSLLDRWAAPAETDVEAIARYVAAELESQSPELQAVDRLLERWALSTVQFDVDRFARRVQGMLLTETRRSGAGRWMLRLGLPLSAAAAIALAMIGLLRPGSAPPTPTIRVAVGPAATAPVSVAQASHVRVEFLREVETVDVQPAPAARLSFVMVGVDPASAGSS